jgi:GT2 family glycosyltransferase
MLKYKVCVVTVTYGNRWQFLEQVIKRALSFTEVNYVVAVNNASDYELPAPDKKVIVLTNTDNKGSAGGYKQGISYAFNKLDCDFIWLLDDDNLPEEGSLSKLLKQWNILLTQRQGRTC